MYRNKLQEIIPVRCVLPACQPYELWPPDVSTGRGCGVGGPQMNKFEQVSSYGHQMSLAGGWAWPELGVPCLMARGAAAAGRGCTVKSNASWVMVTSGPPPLLWTDRHEWKHYLLKTSLAGGNNAHLCDNEPKLCDKPLEEEKTD